MSIRTAYPRLKFRYFASIKQSQWMSVSTVIVQASRSRGSDIPTLVCFGIVALDLVGPAKAGVTAPDWVEDNSPLAGLALCAPSERAGGCCRSSVAELSGRAITDGPEGSNCFSAMGLAVKSASTRHGRFHM